MTRCFQHNCKKVFSRIMMMLFTWMKMFARIILMKDTRKKMFTSIALSSF